VAWEIIITETATEIKEGQKSLPSFLPSFLLIQFCMSCLFFKMHYSNNGQKINDVFKPSLSDAYAFILSNRSSPNNNKNSKTKAVKVTLTHSWRQEIKESQLKNRL
jgi:hypothetical protein